MQVTQSGTVPLRSTTQSDAIDGDAVDATLAAAGDSHAFERLYRRHLGRIHSLVRRMIGDDAEDVTQEIFIRTWQKLGTFRGDSAFGTWLHRLALNLILTRREALGIKRQRHTDDPESLDRLPGRNLPAGFTLDVETAIQRLPDGARQILVLHDIEGYRHEEIAGMLSITSGTSKSQLHHARMALRHMLGQGLSGREKP
jgi:RNA polymerase sigma-70 factor (ECF subfamily)